MKELTVEAKTENITAVTEFVTAELETMDCPMKAEMQIQIAIDELFSNIAYYAYGEETGLATIQVAELAEPHAVTITFIDSGIPYDPLSSEDPDTSLSADQRSAGGLGIFLVKKTMDAVDYAYRDGKNILRITKNL